MYKLILLGVVVVTCCSCSALQHPVLKHPALTRGNQYADYNHIDIIETNPQGETWGRFLKRTVGKPMTDYHRQGRFDD